jgi:hypothetical protein
MRHSNREINYIAILLLVTIVNSFGQQAPPEKRFSFFVNGGLGSSQIRELTLNQTTFESSNQVALSQRIGLNFAYSISDRWQIVAGLNRISQSLSYTNDQNLAQSGALSSISIPLAVRHYTPLSELLKVYASLGSYYETGQVDYYSSMGNPLENNVSQLGALGNYGLSIATPNNSGAFFIEGTLRFDLASEFLQRNEFYLSLGYVFNLF